MKRTVFLLLLILFASVPGREAAKAEGALSFEPDVVTLSGLLLGDYVFLGSGEMLSGSMLHLDEPVTIQGNPQSTGSKKTVSGVEKILLEAAPGVKLDELMGKHVTLKGTLFHSPSEPHHTEVLMKVTEVLQVSEQ